MTGHPAVLEAAVVAAADEKWGEVPVAFVALKENAAATSAELIDHVRARLARFKAPERVVFGPLPKTTTGKVQNVLRERLKPGTEGPPEVHRRGLAKRIIASEDHGERRHGCFWIDSGCAAGVRC